MVERAVFTMLGWQIFVHSVRMVFGNIKQVLQITFGPALAATAAIVALFMVLDIPWDQLDPESGTLPPGTSYGSLVFFVASVAIVGIITMFWIAVSWHRFILLEEYPHGIFPTFRFDRILAYFGRVLLLGLLMGLAFLPLSMVMAAMGAGALTLVVMVAFAFFLIVAFYRLSIILPAAAIGHPVTLGDAWNSTQGMGGAIILLLIVNFLFQFLVQLAFTALAFIPLLGILLTLFFGTLVLPLINVSILTTMFGVFIEKRELT
ncbi:MULTISPECIES: hypothetical protein [unclassified Ruegeria]|uniref:hypothetical protein n=2 Tax=Ruegeria TaxID=97050 RepID=UPI0020C38924|nr:MULTISPECIES: hypothetical protein [unclassified Ruegeria]